MSSSSLLSPEEIIIFLWELSLCIDGGGGGGGILALFIILANSVKKNWLEEECIVSVILKKLCIIIKIKSLYIIIL